MFDHRPALSFSLAPALVSALTLLALACQPVGAETNPWYVGVSQGLTYESNLYRVDTTTDLNNGRDPTQPPVSRSDTVSVTSLVGGIDQPIGRQRLNYMRKECY